MCESCFNCDECGALVCQFTEDASCHPDLDDGVGFGCGFYSESNKENRFQPTLLAYLCEECYDAAEKEQAAARNEKELEEKRIQQEVLYWREIENDM